MASARAAAATNNIQTSYMNFNQVAATGIASPPAITTPLQTLGAAGLPNVKNDPTRLAAAVAQCKTYTGIDGLRRLQVDQANLSAVAPGCGWRHQPSSGVNPLINQAAFGDSNGPFDLKADPMPGGTSWNWNLGKAEKKISASFCANANKCSQMKYLGLNNLCGYCKTTGSVIPVIKNGSVVSARYNNDPNLMCLSSNIVTNYTACPAEGFRSGNVAQSRSAAEGFQDQDQDRIQDRIQAKKEGFASMNMDSLDDCGNDSALTRDCIINAARIAGCSDQGSLIAALNGAPTTGPFNTALAAKPAFQAYQKSANPSLTSQMLADGSVSVATAINDFTKLVGNTSFGSNTKLGASAQDLCLKAGNFDNYNFCAELTPTTIITQATLTCLQQDWMNEGGTQIGKGYPGTTYIGKSYQTYLTYTNNLFKRIDSQDKTINAQAILEFTGVDSSAPSLTNDVPRGDNTRGAEVVWIHLGEVGSGGPPATLIRSDLNLAVNGPVMPTFTSRDELTTKYGVPADNIGFISAYEMRPEEGKYIRLAVASDDGFMVGINQNPFEGTGNKNGDWGSWRYQGASWFISNNIFINPEATKKPNVIVTKFFEGYGGVYFYSLWSAWIGQNMLTGWQDQSASAAARADMYLTQEPLAPWLTYEVCTRPNNGNATLGLLERRWNGPVARTYAGASILCFDTTTTAVSATAPTKKEYGYASFIGKNSAWTMKGRLGFNAVKTLTLMIRPMGGSAAPTAGSKLNILSWCRYNTGKGISLYYTGANQISVNTANRGTFSVPVTPNVWNYIVIQSVNDGRGVYNFTVNATTADSLSTAATLTTFVNSLSSGQNATGGYITGSASIDANESAFLRLGALTVGAQNPDINTNNSKLSFQGDVAFIHGFRTYLTTAAMVRTDVNQQWMSRWPRGDA